VLAPAANNLDKPEHGPISWLALRYRLFQSSGDVAGPPGCLSRHRLCPVLPVFVLLESARNKRQLFRRPPHNLADCDHVSASPPVGVWVDISCQPFSAVVVEVRVSAAAFFITQARKDFAGFRGARLPAARFVQRRISFRPCTSIDSPWQTRIILPDAYKKAGRRSSLTLNLGGDHETARAPQAVD
jgi:hypothetical protein